MLVCVVCSVLCACRQGTGTAGDNEGVSTPPTSVPPPQEAPAAQVPSAPVVSGMPVVTPPSVPQPPGGVTNAAPADLDASKSSPAVTTAPSIVSGKALTPEDIEKMFAQPQQQQGPAQGTPPPEGVAAGAITMIPLSAEGGTGTSPQQAMPSVPGAPGGDAGAASGMAGAITMIPLSADGAGSFPQQVMPFSPGGAAMGAVESAVAAPGPKKVVREPRRKPSKRAPLTPPSDLPAPVYPTLIDAAKVGDATDVENHILRGEDINAQDATGGTALHWAARNGFVPVLEVLLDYGADVNVQENPAVFSPPIMAAYQSGKFDAAAILRDFGSPAWMCHMVAYGDIEGVKQLIAEDPSSIEEENPLHETPLRIAAQGGRKAIAEILLDNGANPLAADINGDTPLRRAAMANQGETVKLLVERGVDVDSRGLRGETILHKKAELGDPSLIEQLLELGADINAKDADGSMPLHTAVACGKRDMAAFLIDHGALVDGMDKQGRTPLHFAAQVGSVEMMNLLIDKGAVVGRQDKAGTTPLHLAAAQAQKSAAAALLDRGADINSIDKRRRTPLHSVVDLDKAEGTEEDAAGQRQGTAYFGVNPDEARIDTARLLLDRGADIEARTRTGMTPLHCASAAGRESLVEFLLDVGAAIEAADHTQRTPLCAAIESGRTEVCRLLLDRGASVAVQDSTKRTPLHYAAALAEPEIAEMLLSLGCDPNAAGLLGRTPLHDACANGAVQTAQVLLAHGAGIEAQTSLRWTPLHAAAEYGSAPLVKILLAHGANPDVLTDESRTPLHLAVTRGNAGAVQVLASVGANPNIQDRNGCTPLHLAAMLRKEKIGVFLVKYGADVDLRTSEDLNALDIAENNGCRSMVSALRPRTGNALIDAIKAGDAEKAERCLKEDPESARARVDGVLPFHLAAREGLRSVFKMLLNRPRSVRETETNAEKFTALHEAARRGHADLIELLLAKDAKVEMTDAKGRTALDWAEVRGHKPVVGVLKANGATPSAPLAKLFDSDQSTQYEREWSGGRVSMSMEGLGKAMLIERPDVLKRVLDADANKANDKIDGRPLLVIAASQGKREVVVLLLDYGADVNARSGDQAGVTALHEAARVGNREIVEILVARGADVALRDASGKTAADVARENKQEALLPLLEAGGGNSNAPS